MVTALAIIAVASVATAATTSAQPRPGAPSPAATAPSALPPVAFRCAAEGVAIQVSNGQMLTDQASLGPDPGDPTLCRWKRGFTTTETYFGLVGRTTTDGLPELRAGLQDLFSGRRTEFTVRKSALAVGGQRNEYDDTWKCLPDAVITVAGRTINTVVFQNTPRALTFPSSSFQTLWYDPALGIWVKRDVVVHPGNRWGEPWEVVKITQ